MADTKQAPHDCAEHIDHRAATGDGRTQPARKAMGIPELKPAKAVDPNAAATSELAALKATVVEQQKKIDWLMKRKETPAEPATPATEPIAAKSDTTPAAK